MTGGASEAPLIRAATAADVADIHALIVELAADTGMRDRVTSTPQDLLRGGFGERPEFEALLAVQGDRSVGLSLFYYEFSTWRGTTGAYLQDLVVLRDYRGSGLARRLVRDTVLAAKRRGAEYLRLSVDAQNRNAIRFYRSIGLQPAADERIFYAKDDAFARLVGDT